MCILKKKTVHTHLNKENYNIYFLPPTTILLICLKTSYSCFTLNYLPPSTFKTFSPKMTTIVITEKIEKQQNIYVCVSAEKFVWTSKCDAKMFRPYFGCCKLYVGVFVFAVRQLVLTYNMAFNSSVSSYTRWAETQWKLSTSHETLTNVLLPFVGCFFVVFAAAWWWWWWWRRWCLMCLNLLNC